MKTLTKINTQPIEIIPIFGKLKRKTMENKDLEREYLDSYDIPEERETSLRLALFAAVCLIITGLVALGTYLVGLINAN